jgi:hypothetical protein
MQSIFSLAMQSIFSLAARRTIPRHLGEIVIAATVG